MAGVERGAVAFSKTGDPQLGEWQDAVILVAAGSAGCMALEVAHLLRQTLFARRHLSNYP
jgi:hypothetical protein